MMPPNIAAPTTIEMPTPIAKVEFRNMRSGISAASRIRASTNDEGDQADRAEDVAGQA